MRALCFALLGLHAAGSAITDFLKQPDPMSIRTFLQNITAKPHLAGTQENNDTARYIADEFKAAGMQVEWHTFESLVSYPLDHAVSLTFPVEAAYNCTLKEPPVDKDNFSHYDAPTFNGYAPNGDVEAELVYANYGKIEDFEYLQSLNISVENKIVIVRYGGNFRGTKVYLAQQRGAVGVLIYSDPADDGQSRGTPYPEGPWRPQFGVQRGSVQFLNICPGDPRRVEECLGTKEANYTGTLIPEIPVHPLSWGDAEYLLRQLNHTVAPAAWQGGIPNLNYSIGPGAARARLYSLQNFTVRTLINVCGTIPGSAVTEGSVILGNHRDAWVYGAADPSSGTAIMLELARSFGVLRKGGWKPRRNIVVCSWDGEEYALLGSTAWTSDHKELVLNSVAYLNVDVGVAGQNFSADASPALITAIDTATAQVPHPNGAVSLGSAWPRLKEVQGSAWPGDIGVLGSGSDYTSFLHHWGVPSAHMGFSGSYGVYHSVYDSFPWMDNWGDKGFNYSLAMTRLWGVLALVLSEPERVPLTYNDTAAALYKYLAFANQSAPKEINFTALRASIEVYSERANTLKNTNDRIDVVNSITHNAERNFLFGQGLPGRPYFRHLLQAPGLYLGYGSDVFPGITEAIRDKNWKQAQDQTNLLAATLEFAAKELLMPDPAKSEGLTGWELVAIVGSSVVLLAFIAYCARRQRKVQKGYEAI